MGVGEPGLFRPGGRSLLPVDRAVHELAHAVEPPIGPGRPASRMAARAAGFGVDNAKFELPGEGRQIVRPVFAGGFIYLLVVDIFIFHEDNFTWTPVRTRFTGGNKVEKYFDSQVADNKLLEAEGRKNTRK